MKKNIEDYAIVYSNVLTPQICKKSIKELKKIKWEQHKFYNPRNEGQYSPSPGQELFVTQKTISTYFEIHFCNDFLKNIYVDILYFF